MARNDYDDYDDDYASWCEEAKKPVYELGILVGWSYPNGMYEEIDDLSEEDGEEEE